MMTSAAAKRQSRNHYFITPTATDPAIAQTGTAVCNRVAEAQRNGVHITRDSAMRRCLPCFIHCTVSDRFVDFTILKI